MTLDAMRGAMDVARDTQTIALNARGLRKDYGATVALEHADISLRSGSVHALLGENAARKSTLVKILAGVTRPDAVASP